MPDGLPLDRAAAPDGGERAHAILDLARDAFVEKGFEATSMRDLARAAGMSVGNFYRYFPSKAALVEALIDRDLTEMEGTFDAILASPEPLAALQATLRYRLSEDCSDDHPLWAEIMAAAARKPEVAAILERMHDNIAAGIARVLGHVRGLAPAEAEARLGAHARLLVMLVQGAALRGGTGGRDDAALLALIHRTAEGVVLDALADASPGAPLSPPGAPADPKTGTTP